MNFLKPRGRVLIELCGVLYAGMMVMLAIVEWAGQYSWRLAPSSLLLVAGIAVMVVSRSGRDQTQQSEAVMCTWALAAGDASGAHPATRTRLPGTGTRQCRAAIQS